MKKKNFIYKIINKDLKNKKYKTIKTRFPPEPNGYLHIGHALSLYINFNISKDYNGKFYLRFDDTNPKTEKKIYIENIKKDLIWLGYIWHKKKYASDYFNIYYKYAIKLIKKKLAYIDDLSIKDIKKYRGSLKNPGINSPFRDRNIKENISMFKKMKNGEYKEGEKCLRAKIDMKSKNIILRDPVIYRIKYNSHYKTKKKWCIYPTYDFAHCIADSIEKITHSICTLEFINNRLLYEWILKNISINHIPKQYEFSKLNITYTITSKRKIKYLINKKKVNGWNDPRLMTLSGMKNRGFTPKSIIDFCKLIGVSKKEHIIDISILENCLRKDLNKISFRIMGVINPLKIKIKNLKKKIKIKIPNHPQNPSMGYRYIYLHSSIYIDEEDFKENSNEQFKRLTINQSVKLRYAGIIKIKKIIKKEDKILHIECIYIHKKKTKNIGIIHWISLKNSLKTKYILYNKLFISKDPNKEKNILSIINEKSIIIKYGYIEKYIKYINKKTSLQLERIGYFKLFKKSNLILSQILLLNNKNKF